MPFDLFLEPATFTIPQISPLRAFKWQYLTADIGRAVAEEEQYLIFQLELLNRLYYTEVGHARNPQWGRPINLTLRAGIIKAAVLITASICEAVLRAHAEYRGYDLPENRRRRTMGRVLRAWELEDERPQPELEHIWDTLQSLHSIRNNIHLFKAATDPEASFDNVLAQEEQLIPQLRQTIDFLANLRS